MHYNRCFPTLALVYFTPNSPLRFKPKSLQYNLVFTSVECKMSKFAFGAIFAVVLVAVVVFGLGVFEEANEGPVESAAESVGNAVEGAAETVDDAADSVGDAVEQ